MRARMFYRVVDKARVFTLSVALVSSTCRPPTLNSKQYYDLTLIHIATYLQKLRTYYAHDISLQRTEHFEQKAAHSKVE